jgi:beta-lactam-binding protein with PASTA domain
MGSGNKYWDDLTVYALGSPPEMVDVPDVVGFSQADAEAAIVAIGLNVGTVTTAYSDTVPAGEAISQDPVAGTAVPSGSAVDLVVSLGPLEMLDVPDVVGISQADAEAAIAAAGLSVGTVSTAYSDTVPAGEIISQNPVAGTSVPIGSAVDLVVSLGPLEMVDVPDVVGFPEAGAEAAIVAAGLTVGTKTTAQSDTVPEGEVISQDPVAGTAVPSGSAVDLVVSLGTAAYQQDFEGYAAGEDPADWLDTGANSSLLANDSLFKVFDLSGEKAFGTSSTATNIHSHYGGAGVGALSGYEYTGRMMITASGGGIGITFFSEYPLADAYYRLRRYASNPSFHLASHGTSVSGDKDTGVVPVANVWYQFRIQVEDTGTQTEIRAKVWTEGGSEPVDWQAEAYDVSPARLTAGTIGVWSMGSGHKYWDDMAVVSLLP